MSTGQAPPRSSSPGSATSGWTLCITCRIAYTKDTALAPTQWRSSVAVASLILTVNCGSSPEAEKGLAAARAAGADVLVLDHHLCPRPPTGPLIMVNPNRADDDSGLQDLCATGVTYMFLLAARQRIGEYIWPWGQRTIPLPDLDEFLDLIALATVADAVPLRGLNRAFVQHGLTCLAERKHVGLTALSNQLELQAQPSEASIGWNLAPALNAPGRIGENPYLATDLLLATSPIQADQLAQQCRQLNLLRRSIQERSAGGSAEQNLIAHRIRPSPLECGGRLASRCGRYRGRPPGGPPPSSGDRAWDGWGDRNRLRPGTAGPWTSERPSCRPARRAVSAWVVSMPPQPA